MPGGDALLRRVQGRIAASWRDAAAAAAAGALAWVAAVALSGHQRPVFAAISAIVCLAPGLPNHGRQAVGLILGVATGIVVGEFALLLPDTYPLARVSLTAFFAILVASTYGQPPIVPIQSGVSAVLILALGPEYAGPLRLLNVAIGAAVGLLFSQVLLTPDPVRLLDSSAAGLVARLGDGLRAGRIALRDDDPARAHGAVETFSNAHLALAAVTGAVDTARSVSRWSLRGRLSARRVMPVADMYERRAARLYASGLLFGTALASAMARRTAPPPGLAARLDHLIGLIDGDPAPTPETGPEPAPLPLSELADEWRRAAARLEETVEALQAFRDLAATPAGAPPSPTGLKAP